MSTQPPSRQPAGVPVGGQFAASQRSESDTDLTEPAPRVSLAEAAGMNAAIAKLSARYSLVCADDPDAAEITVMQMKTDGAVFAEDGTWTWPEKSWSASGNNLELDATMAYAESLEEKLVWPEREHYEPADLAGIVSNLDHANARAGRMALALQSPQSTQPAPVDPHVALARAQEEWHRVNEKVTRAALDSLVAYAKEEYPSAAYLGLEDSDQSDGYVTGSVFDANGAHLGGLEDHDEANDAADWLRPAQRDIWGAGEVSVRHRPVEGSSAEPFDGHSAVLKLI